MKTIARWSFWVQPERRAAFDAVYAKQLKPLFEKHGFSDFDREDSTDHPVVRLLFRGESVPEWMHRYERLTRDGAWQDQIRALAPVTGFAEGRQIGFSIHQTSIGQGQSMVLAGLPVPLGTGLNAQPGHWRNFDATDGLANTNTTALCQDRHGFIWAATPGGAIRFDGHAFSLLDTRSGLIDDGVRAILEDGQGGLWFGTWSGASYYDGESFRSCTTADGLVDNKINCLALDPAGGVWFGTAGGASRYDGHSFTSFTRQDGLSHDSILSMTCDRQGGLWLGTMDGVSHYDGSAFRAVASNGFSAYRTKAVLEDGAGEMWFGGNGGVGRYDLENGIMPAAGKIVHGVLALLEDGAGNLWIGSQRGLGRYDGHSTQVYSTADGLGTNSIQALLQDREGHIWAGRSTGLSCFEADTFMQVQREDGEPLGHVRAIAADEKGDLWLGTWDGVMRYDGTSLTCYSTQDGWQHGSVGALLRDADGRLWLGTEKNGICLYDGTSFTCYGKQEGLFRYENIVALLQDRGGRIWFGGTDSGLSCLSGKTVTWYGDEDGLSNRNVRALLEDREGGLWCLTETRLERFNGREFIQAQLDGVRMNAIHDLALDLDGNIWLGTSAGVWCFDGRSFSRPRLKMDMEKVGVRAVFCGTDGHVWFGTSGGGVVLFDGQVAQQLTVDDGLSGNIVETIFQDERGDYWFGTDGGLTRYRPARDTHPEVRITAVTADRRHESPQAVEIPHSTGLTVFEFEGLSLKTRPGRLVYQYRLEGRDESWQTTEQRRLEYQALAPGRYVFRVRAVDRDLNYSVERVFGKRTEQADARAQQKLREIEGRVSHRFAIARNVSLLSPGYAMQYPMEALLGTGVVWRDHFHRQAEAYRDVLREFLQQRDAVDPESPHILFLPEYMSKAEMDPELIPRFRPAPLDLDTRLREGLVPLLALLFETLAALLFAGWAARRMEIATQG
ncbi:MAG TPA: two-component regulator propeller domain-containing protein [Candidatus Latescibacteria bacterium]|nr:hypothetical protein [Gemmatimonadaceae bacterium]MDP6016864.1 two-component regulator propeller domain-containing protein [Candidatus Latescibacterota bacterium]HJP29847.1 two-component regulator propeller domain-containing protein [Candidatus Latescibacterota bacterium]